MLNRSENALFFPKEGLRASTPQVSNGRREGGWLQVGIRGGDVENTCVGSSHGVSSPAPAQKQGNASTAANEVTDTGE